MVVTYSSDSDATVEPGNREVCEGLQDVFVFPVSLAQQRLWFMDQLEPGSVAYNSAYAHRLSGPLKLTALEQGLNEIIQRHEVLRTTFEAVEGRPVQVIAPTLTLPLEVTDLRSLPEAQREAQALKMASEQAQQPFDLSTGPLVRASLFRLDEEEHLLLVMMHHIVTDAWSRGVFLRELSALYDAFSHGQPSPLPELPIQYADFTVWQREWLQGETLQQQLAYWKQHLDQLPVLELPSDFPRPPVQSYRGDRQTRVLPDRLLRALKDLSRREGTTLFMTMLAAFSSLLYRLTGQEDVVIGSTVSGRPRLEVESLMGLFINMLVLRNDLSGNPTFRELLARIRRTCLEAYDRQDVPFERLVEELQPERHLNRSPLFQVLINMPNVAIPEPDWSGLSVERLDLDRGRSGYDMTLSIAEVSGETHLRLTYNTDLFSQERMTCLLQQFRHLLEQVVSSPGTPIRSYSLVTAESRPLLPDPSIALDEPRHEPVTVQFDRWARTAPAHPAIVQGNRCWTYSELASSARKLAHMLRAGGLEKGETVAVVGRRSYGLVAGVMSVLLSGGVLLLVDPDFPAQRQQLMLQKANARTLLRVRDKEQKYEQSEELALDKLDVDQSTGQPTGVEPQPQVDGTTLPEISPDDPAYVFFTSGTTGVPRGVLGCHKGLSHFIDWARETFAIQPEDRCAQLISPTFEPIMRDLFLPLTSGATVCLPEETDIREPEGFGRWLERERISILNSVPSLAQFWLDNMPGEISLLAVRRLTLGGEPLTDTLVRQCRAVLSDSSQIFNLYGPTETILAKCYYRVPEEVPHGVQPIGSPLPQTQALVFTSDGRLCGIGEPGEIVLRTPFRARGYLNLPAEQEGGFVINPFRDDEKDLLYYTGDRGRYRPDGLLEILGRLDNQVKIRGVRAEPSEVTAVLAGHPGVRACVVIPEKNQQGETYFAAYVVASGQDTVMEQQIRSYLAQHLPVALIPTSFVFLERLPLTPSGKVDRRALPAIEPAKPVADDVFVASSTPIEELLAGIWADVLGREQIDVTDNFFELGGHSLLALRVVARVRDVFQTDLPVRSIFEMPTVAQLAGAIDEARRAGPGRLPPPIKPLRRDRHRWEETRE